MYTTGPARPEHVVYPALPTLPPGCRVCWVGEYVWDGPARPEAWARGPDGRLWVSRWVVGLGWGGWTRNRDEAG